MKKITTTEALELIGYEPDNFYTYYLHLSSEGKYIIRNHGLWLCNDELEAQEAVNMEVE
jgi:hypothetical protein